MAVLLENIIAIIGGGLLFAFFPVMFYLANSDSDDIRLAFLVMAAMFVIGAIGAAYTL